MSYVGRDVCKHTRTRLGKAIPDWDLEVKLGFISIPRNVIIQRLLNYIFVVS